MKTTVELNFDDFVSLLDQDIRRGLLPGSGLPVYVGRKVGGEHAPGRMIAAVFETPMCRYVYGENLTEESPDEAEAIDHLAKRIWERISHSDLTAVFTARTIRW